MTPSTILFVFLATFAGVSLASWAHTWLTDAIDETRQTKAVPWRVWAGTTRRAREHPDVCALDGMGKAMLMGVSGLRAHPPAGTGLRPSLVHT